MTIKQIHYIIKYMKHFNITDILKVLKVFQKEDWLICQISPLVKYRQNQNQAHHNSSLSSPSRSHFKPSLSSVSRLFFMVLGIYHGQCEKWTLWNDLTEQANLFLSFQWLNCHRMNLDQWPVTGEERETDKTVHTKTMHFTWTENIVIDP